MLAPTKKMTAESNDSNKNEEEETGEMAMMEELREHLRRQLEGRAERQTMKRLKVIFHMMDQRAMIMERLLLDRPPEPTLQEPRSSPLPPS